MLIIIRLVASEIDKMYQKVAYDIDVGLWISSAYPLSYRLRSHAVGAGLRPTRL